MADLSLDEIIATKRLNFKVQPLNQNVRKGRSDQQQQNFKPGFVSKVNRPGIQRKRPISAPNIKAKAFRGSPVQNNGANLSGPGKGQIDARDMITIRNRIKIADARAKIIQKRISQGSLDVRSKLQHVDQLQLNQRLPAPVFSGQQQQKVFQRPPQPVRPPSQQRFQSPQQPGFQFRQPQPLYQQQTIRFNQQQAPQFNRQVPQFKQQQHVPQFRQQPPQLQQQFNQPSLLMNQPPTNFGLTNFNQLPPSFQQVPAQNNSGDLINFTVAVNAGQISKEPMGPLTRTLVNPLASGGAVVEDTGSSLKITRSVPDVTFDGQNLTVTRRLPQPSQETRPVPLSDSGSRSTVNNTRVPVIQFQNDRFKSTPIQPPSTTPSNIIRTRLEPSSNIEKGRAPSIKAPTQNRSLIKSPNPTPTVIKPAPNASSEYLTNTRYKTVKNVTAVTTSSRTQHFAPPPQARLRTIPQDSVPDLPPKRPALSALSRIQLNTESVPVASRLSSPAISATKRLAPHPSTVAQPAGMPQVASAKMAVKRRAPMSLSQRFALSSAGNPIPVITDHPPVKKRRAPEPEAQKEDYEEDFEMKEQFEEEEEAEEDTATILLSPLQGFRILVSNLHTSVTQDDIIELFGAIGPLKRANLLTRGQAEVAFIHKEHAITALKKYHGRELDGQPMYVKLTTPLNAKVMKAPVSEDTSPSLPVALRSSKKPPAPSLAPVEIPLIHKALFKTGGDTAPSKSVRFTVKL